MSMPFNGTNPENVSFNGSTVYKIVRVHNGGSPTTVWKKSFSAQISLRIDFSTMSYDNYQGCLYSDTTHYVYWRTGALTVTGSTTSFTSVKVTKITVNGTTSETPSDPWEDDYETYWSVPSARQEVLNTSLATKYDADHMLFLRTDSNRDSVSTPGSGEVVVTITLQYVLTTGNTKTVSYTKGFTWSGTLPSNYSWTWTTSIDAIY